MVRYSSLTIAARLLPYPCRGMQFILALVELVPKFEQALNEYINQKQKLEAEDEGERRSKLQDQESNLELAFEKNQQTSVPFL